MGVSTTQAHSTALLGRALDYTRGSLELVCAGVLAAPTPCDRWDLQAVLEHLDDSLAAFTEAAAIGYVDLSPTRELPTADRLVASLRLRARAMLDAWTARVTSAPIGIGDAALARDRLAAIGALEIGVHGWDVAQACRCDRPLPRDLATELYDVALTHVTRADRPQRFGYPLPTEDGADPSRRLLAQLGRRA